MRGGQEQPLAAADNGAMTALVLVVMIRVHRVTLVTRAGRIRASQIARSHSAAPSDRCGFPSLPAEGARMAVEQGR